MSSEKGGGSFDMPVLIDEYQLVGESLQVTRTAMEVYTGVPTRGYNVS